MTFCIKPIIILLVLHVSTSLAIFHTTEEWCEAAIGFRDMNPFCEKPKENHKVCMKTVFCKAAPNCRIIPLSLAEKDYMVDIHNEYRNRVALGKESKMEYRKTAANMNALSWDLDLEFLALCHGNDCEDTHDLCRVVPPKNSVGQNYYMITGVTNKTCEEIFKMAADDWYDEAVGVTDPHIYTAYGPDPEGNPIGHFTQMVWATTSRIGCVMVERMDAPTKSEVTVWCNYGPSGNVHDLPVFKPGKPASKCPPLKWPNRQYKGLCGKVFGARMEPRDAATPSPLGAATQLLVIACCCWLLP